MQGETQYQRGMVAYRAERYVEAIRCLTPLLEPGSGVNELICRFYLGQAHYHVAMDDYDAGRYREATRHFQVAARLNPTGGGLPNYLAQCYVRMRNFDLAAHAYESMLAETPEDPDKRVSYALMLWKEGRIVQAISTLQEGLHASPESTELHYHLGVLLAADGELADAERSFTTVLVLDPDHVNALERMAQCHAALGRSESARACLIRAHELAPGNARVAWQLSLLAGDPLRDEPAPALGRRLKDRLDPQEQVFQQLGEAIVEEPEFIEAFLDLPESAVDEELFSTLATVFEKALERYPEYADLHYHCGQIYRRLRRLDDAIAHTESAVQVNPEFVNGLILLARLYAQTDKPANAAARLQDALTAGAEYPDVYVLLGRMRQLQGDQRAAREAYEHAVELDGNYDEAREALAALTS